MASGATDPRPRCPQCGAAHDPLAVSCPLCGAKARAPLARTPRVRVAAVEADLGMSVARVEETVAAQGRDLAGRGVRRRAGASSIVFATFVAVGGLFLIPAQVLVGSFTFLAGVALLAIATLFYYAQPRGTRQ